MSSREGASESRNGVSCKGFPSFEEVAASPTITKKQVPKGARHGPCVGCRQFRRWWRPTTTELARAPRLAQGRRGCEAGRAAEVPKLSRSVVAGRSSRQGREARRASRASLVQDALRLLGLQSSGDVLEQRPEGVVNRLL